jgi:carboxypeptidase Q
MRHYFLLLFFSLISIFSQADSDYSFSNQQQKKAQKLIDAALQDDTAYRLIESLTTEVGPRLAGSEAEQRARDWATRNLEALGFKNIRVEHFDVPLWQRGIEKAEVTAPYPQQLHISTLGGSIATPAEGVEGELVSVPTIKALKAMADNSLKGKIIFVDQSMARTQDGSGYRLAGTSPKRSY